jgi:hypothetical protein
LEMAKGTDELVANFEFLFIGFFWADAGEFLGGNYDNWYEEEENGEGPHSKNNLKYNECEMKLNLGVVS